MRTSHTRLLPPYSLDALAVPGTRARNNIAKRHDAISDSPPFQFVKVCKPAAGEFWRRRVASSCFEAQLTKSQRRGAWTALRSKSKSAEQSLGAAKFQGELVDIKREKAAKETT